MPTLTFQCEVCATAKTRYVNPKLPPPRFCSPACMGAARGETGPRVKRKYAFSPAMDAAIRQAFWQRRGSLKCLADTEPAFATIPYYMVKYRAKELGLVRTVTHQVWEAAELAFCQDRYERGLGIEALVQAMRRQGWQRSKSAIVGMMEKVKQRRHGGLLTLGAVAQALGIDYHAVTRWADKEWLVTQTHVSDRVRLVTPEHLRRFILEYPSEVAKGCPDVLWLIAILTDPDIRANTPRPTQRRRQEASSPDCRG